MKALVLSADWSPKTDYTPTQRELDTRKVRRGSKVWKNPRIALKDLPEPEPAGDEVLLEVSAVGICGSDMHMYEASADGYMLYPSLVKTSNTLGHEFAGRVVEVGRRRDRPAKGRPCRG